MVMQVILDNHKLTEAELIARRESGVNPYAHWDDAAYAAHGAASLVLLEAVMGSQVVSHRAFEKTYSKVMEAA